MSESPADRNAINRRLGQLREALTSLDEIIRLGVLSAPAMADVKRIRDETHKELCQMVRLKKKD